MKHTIFNRLKSVVSYGVFLAAFFIFLPSTIVAQQADFAIFFSPSNSTLSEELAEVLKGNDDPMIVQCNSVQEVIDSDAKVLVLFMDFKEDKKFNKEQVEALKRFKIIGIDIGSAQLFKRLGLEINGDHVIHNYIDLTPKLYTAKNPLLDVSQYGKTIPVFKLASNDDPVDKNINFAMHIHPKSHFRKYVDVILTWQGGVYAPIVKQGNYMMVGIAAPASTWTPDYKDFFHDISMAMLQQPLKPFETVKWELTDPDSYIFKLAKGNDLKEMSYKTFYFQFTKPVNFNVHLEHENSDNISLVFRGKNNKHWNRQDAENGELLDLSINITQEDLKLLGNDYWELSIFNYDHKHTADCKLKIMY